MWRLLENGEQIIEGDEYFDYGKPHRKGGKWLKCGDFYMWMTVSKQLLHPIRRKFSQDDKEQTKNVNQQLKAEIALKIEAVIYAVDKKDFAQADMIARNIQRQLSAV